MTSLLFFSFTTRAVRGLLRSPLARPLRFAGAGATAGALQLGLLTVLTVHGWDTLLANLTAFLVAAQLNFLLSTVVTWRDRHRAGSLRHRWIFFHASIAVMAVLNMLVFVAMRALVPTLAASALGIAAAAWGNYVAGDRLIFRQPPSAALSSSPGSVVA